MLFHSTSRKSKNINFQDAVRLGLAPDGGLFMPDFWPKLPKSISGNLQDFNFRQIAFEISKLFIKVIPKKELAKIIKGAFDFQIPLRHLKDNLYVLELFHGPTMAFKDFGARFLARISAYYLRNQNRQLNIIVATSGDTGSAVASGFFNLPNVKVYILYPSGKVSPLQEKQLTTYGGNITAMEVKGTFDDCQRLAKQILSDPGLKRQMFFSSANSINFGRLLPQSFYYFYAYGQLTLRGIKAMPVFVVPSGNFGHLTSGLMAKKMGLPVEKFVAATNINDIVPKYLKTGKYIAKKSKHTISNAMDVGSPSNFARMSEMYRGDYKAMGKDIASFSISDKIIRQTIKHIFKDSGYVCDPHTAVGIAAALKYQKKQSGHPVVVLSTAHPAKFKEIVEPVIHRKIKLPKQLQAAMKKKKKSIIINPTLKSFIQHFPEFP